MSLNPGLSILAANVAADSVCALLNDGYLRIYDGNQPPSPDAAITTQALLAELRFAPVAFSRSRDGIAPANTLAEEVSAPTSGRASWVRALSADGVAIFDGSVGLVSANLTLSSVDIEEGTRVVVTALAYEQKRT